MPSIGRLLLRIDPYLVAPSSIGVGAAHCGATDDSRRLGFVLRNGRFSTTRAPGAIIESLPFGIDDRGRIVGFYF